LRARLLEAQREVHSLYVVYRAEGYDPQRFPQGAYLHRVVAAKSPCLLDHVSAHGHDRLDWHDDFYQQRAHVTADRLDTEFPVNRVYAEYPLRPDEGLPGSLPQEFFFLATGLWPLEGRPPPRPDGRPYVLREVAAAKEYSVVR